MSELQLASFAEIDVEDWAVFHQSCIDPVVFYQFPFLKAYSKTTGNKVEVLLYREGGKLLLALPGIFEKSTNVFQNLTHLGWDNLNFLMIKGISSFSIKVFFSELKKLVDLMVYKNISENCHQLIVENTTKYTSFKGFRCPYVYLRNSYDDYLEDLSVSFKRMIKNRTNFCLKHGVEFKFFSNLDGEKMEEAFSELNRLHGIRMNEIDSESKFLKPESQQFHRTLRENTGKEFILIVQAIKDEKVIGTLYGFVSSNRYVYFASGIDPNFSKYSLGVVLIGRVIDNSISNNYDIFDFLRGTEDYKFKWTQETNQNYTLYSPLNLFGKYKALKVYWDENKHRIGRKQTLINLKKFFW